MPVPRNWKDKDRENGEPSRFNWWQIVGAALSSMIASAVGVGIGIQVGLARVEVRVTQLESDHQDMHRQISDLDLRGSRTLPVIESRLMNLETRTAAGITTAERANNVASVLEQRIKLLEETVNNRTRLIEDLLAQSKTLTPLQQALIDNLKADLRRIEERQERVVQALDNTYSMLQDHLRSTGQQQQPNTMRPKP